MFRKGDADVAGMGAKDPEQPGPPAWNSYIFVDDVEEIAKGAAEAGANLVLPPMDVMSAGRMCILQDPTGAHVSLWQAGDHQCADLFNEHGTLIWNELMTRDVEAALAFYTEVIGWDTSPMPMPDGSTYHILKVGERMNGGMIAISDEMPAEIPAHWGVYFAVDDVDATAKQVVDLGGSLLKEAFDMQAGRMAVVSDPQGAAFSIMTPNEVDE